MFTGDFYCLRGVCFFDRNQGSGKCFFHSYYVYFFSCNLFLLRVRSDSFCFFSFIVSYFVFLSGCYRKSSRDKAQNVSITGVFNEDSDKLWELKSREIRLQLHRLGWWVTGLLYCGVLPAVVMTGVQKFGYPYFVSLLLIGFSSDTFAYFGGRFFGHRHFVPLISPQKTIEGSLLGLLAGTMAGSFYLSLIDIKSSLILIVALSLTSSLFSQIGDLFESMIKRYHGIKDSGIIMPGHGGLLDRIDSILFAAPVVYVWMLFI